MGNKQRSYVLTGRMWCARATIVRAIEAAGGKVTGAVAAGCVLVVGPDVVDPDTGVVVEETAKLKAAEGIGVTVVSSDVLKHQLQSVAAAANVLGLKVKGPAKPAKPTEPTKKRPRYSAAEVEQLQHAIKNAGNPFDGI